MWDISSNEEIKARAVELIIMYDLVVRGSSAATRKSKLEL